MMPELNRENTHRDELRLCIVAGETSGDLHGANLLRALKRHLPAVEAFGVGGDRLIAEGLLPLRHIRETNFMGFVEVLRNLGTIRRLFQELEAAIATRRPQLLILIDYPGFNLRLARRLKQRNPALAIVYYIAPQVWAWKKNRIAALRKYTDTLITILPFEPPFFERHGLKVQYFGHPLLDALPSVPLRQPDSTTRQRPCIALLPGSRKMEVLKLMNTFAATAQLLPEYDFAIGQAPVLASDLYTPWLRTPNLRLWNEGTYPLLQQADAALVASGTATLETALLGVPQSLCYRGHGLSVWLARHLIQIPYIGLPNLILNTPVIPERIQGKCSPQQLAQDLKQHLFDPIHRKQLFDHYATLRAALGESGTSDRIARFIAETYFPASL
jgi:lipid-A-disaccharide synthase